jgi:hypothetical protein
MTAGIQTLSQESQCTSVEYTQCSPSHRISSPEGRKVMGGKPAPPPKRCSSAVYETASAGNHYASQAWRAQGSYPRSITGVVRIVMLRLGRAGALFLCIQAVHPPPSPLCPLVTSGIPAEHHVSQYCPTLRRLWSSPVPSQGSHPSWSPSTSHTDRIRQPEAYPQIMELDIIMQIVFGIFTISIAVFGIWFAWHSTRGMSLHFQLGFYPNAPPDLSLTHLASQERPAAYPLRPTCLVSAA